MIRCRRTAHHTLDADLEWCDCTGGCIYGLVKQTCSDSDGYDAMDDLRASLEYGYKVIRERMAAGGPGWERKT